MCRSRGLSAALSKVRGPGGRSGVGRGRKPSLFWFEELSEQSFIHRFRIVCMPFPSCSSPLPAVRVYSPRFDISAPNGARCSVVTLVLLSILFKIFIYLFLERGEGKEKERERNIHVWLPLTHPQLGTWPATQACVLTGNRTGDPLVLRLALNPLSHTSQGLVSPSFLCMGKRLGVEGASAWCTPTLPWD